MSYGGLIDYLAWEDYRKSMHSDEGIFTQSLLEDARKLYDEKDPAHDFSHILRVFRNAKKIGQAEGADMSVLLLAVLLHDAKEGLKHSIGSLDAKQDQEFWRQEAVNEFLERIDLSEEKKAEVLYAVEVHRFTRGIEPETLEAKILQDADRLDAIGAIGIARVFMTGGTLKRMLYNPADPFCRSREPDDGKWNLDHFYKKLLKLEWGMHTMTAKRIARRRSEVLKRYLQDLEEEIGEDCWQKGREGKSGK